mmetsp:Transcript_140542/g.449208  ORF Transcript_140542/g.449208 Transcript_140542/m.449208 type:complete len:205 (+) Transcript_140542:602-1216(+)
MGKPTNLVALPGPLPQAAHPKKLGLILLQMVDDLGASPDRLVHQGDALLHHERSTGAGYPAVLLVVVVNTLDMDLVQGRHRCNCPRRGSYARRGRRDRGRRRSARSWRCRRPPPWPPQRPWCPTSQRCPSCCCAHSSSYRYRSPDGDGRFHPVGGDLDGVARVSLNLLEVGDALLVVFAPRIRFDPLASAPDSTAGALADNDVC